MRMRINEYTWIHTSIFALAAAFVTSACDEAEEVVEDEDLAVEALDDEEKQESEQLDGQADELANPATENEADNSEDAAAVEERRRRGDDDDDHGGRRRDDDDGHRHGRRHHDDDGHRHGRRHHDDDGGHRHGRW